MRLRRRPSLLARLTEPLSFADPVVNRITDTQNEHFPWTWWPAVPPNPRKPFDRTTHAVLAAWTLLSLILSVYAVERGLRRFDALPEGRALRRDRAFQVLGTVVMWAEICGAWERRARRRPRARR